MSCRQRILQLLASITVLVCYLQFQLFSYTERRLFLKKMKLALPGTPPKQQPDTICSQSRTTTSSKGLTLMTWQSQHIKDIRSFIEYPLFPKHPTTVQFDVKSSLRLPFSSRTGWLFGSLLAPESGEYRFAVSSAGNAQLRLSKNDDAEGSQIIASLTLSAEDERPAAGQYNKHSSQTSLDVFLHKCRNYFIEVLFNNDEKHGHVEVAWETPSSLVYEVIPSFFLSTFIDAQDFAYNGENLLIFEDTMKTSSLFWHFEREKSSVKGELLLDDWSRLPYMSSKHATGIVPSCSADLKSHASSPLLEIAKTNSEMTLKFVDDYTKRLVKANQGKYSFTKLHDSEERTIDSEERRRFLLNLEFKDNLMDMRVRIAEYLFYAGDKRELCTINEFKWRRDAMVTIIAVIRKMESWSHHFMDHLSEMMSKLRDARFNVIMVAPQKMKGYFQTVVSQNALSTHSHVTLLLISVEHMLNMEHIIKVVIPHIKIPNTIIFLTDIHVQMPTEILEHVRKRTVEGKTIFIPWPENVDSSSHDNATVINPLDTTKEDNPPSFSMYVSDWKRLHDKKAARRNQNTDTGHKESWWQAIGNGALEIYASKIPQYLYFKEN